MEPTEVVEKQPENRFIKPTWTAELLVALAKAQAEFPDLEKNKTAKIDTDKGSYEYSYVDLATLLKLTRPMLNKNGLSISQSVSTRGNGEGLAVLIDTYLFHSTGGYLHDQLVLPVTRTGKMNSIQAVGSVVTYGRRYSLEAILGVASQEDTDARGIEGNGDSGKSGKSKSGGSENKDDMSVELTTLLDKAIASGDAQLKKDAEGAKKSMKNIKDKKSLQNFLNLWKKKLSGMDLTASKDQPKDSTDMTPEQVADAVQGEVVDPKDPGASEAFDA